MSAELGVYADHGVRLTDASRSTIYGLWAAPTEHQAGAEDRPVRRGAHRQDQECDPLRSLRRGGPPQRSRHGCAATTGSGWAAKSVLRLMPHAGSARFAAGQGQAKAQAPRRHDHPAVTQPAVGHRRHHGLHNPRRLGVGVRCHRSPHRRGLGLGGPPGRPLRRPGADLLKRSGTDSESWERTSPAAWPWEHDWGPQYTSGRFTGAHGGALSGLADGSDRIVSIAGPASHAGEL